MLKSIKLKFGPNSTDSPLEFEPGSMTVFVGPNNSGKSLILREIEGYIHSGESQSGHQIVDQIVLDLPDKSEIEQMLPHLEHNPLREKPLAATDSVQIRKFIPGGQTDSKGITLNALLHAIDNNNLSYIYPHFVDVLTIRIDARRRFELTHPQKGGSLEQPPQNYLMALFTDDEARREIRSITADAFGLYFVINPLGMQRLRIQMARREPLNAHEEHSLGQEARDFYWDAIDISQFSDGVNAFTGLVAFLMSSDYRIILIDEPELCLHPPLVRKLGSISVNLAFRRKGNVFASTHSADFLMGCVQSGKEVNVVRLTYNDSVATARLLSSKELKSIMHNPLMRSSGVLSALFHDGAIVAEADADRVFYQEINERLLATGSGIDGSVFLNAQNKQTVHRIVSPLSWTCPF